MLLEHETDRAYYKPQFKNERESLGRTNGLYQSLNYEGFKENTSHSGSNYSEKNGVKRYELLYQKAFEQKKVRLAILFEEFT